MGSGAPRDSGSRSAREIAQIGLPGGGSVAFRADDPRSVALLARLHRSGRTGPRLVLGLLRRSGTAGRFLAALRPATSGGEGAIAELTGAVSVLLGEQPAAVAMDLAPDLSRATIAVMLASGETVFVKARTGAGDSLSSEHEFLQALGRRCAALVVPEVLHLGTVGGWTMIAMSDVGGVRPSAGRPDLAEVLPYLEELRSISATEADLSTALGGLDDSPGATMPAVSRLLALLDAGVTSLAVVSTMAHGDFTPWNLELRRDGVMSVWDWERAMTCAPWPYDAIHYTLQSRRFLRGHSRDRALRGALADLARNAAALRIAEAPEAVARSMGLYAVRRALNEDRLGRPSTDGAWLLDAVTALLE